MNSIKTDGFQFIVVKADNLKPKERKKSNSKWSKVLVAMKRLNIGDYIIVAKGVPALKLYQKIGNVKHSLKRFIGKGWLPNRTFEFKGLPEAIDGGTGYQVIIRRTI